ncbi:MAG: nitroreductase family protein [Candidatus Bathyarchaeota archaeon]|nr:nitroreductase family protein [Candidatus Bathyarchaeota archaeon]
MDAIEAIKNRRSIRRFATKAISEQQVLELVDAARHAPSAGNIQPWEFIVVTDQQKKRQLAVAALDQTFIEEAPVVIVVCTDSTRSNQGYGSRGVNLYSIQDTAAATENILLAAHAMGLGTCWVGAFREEPVKEALKIPAHIRPVAMIPVGFYSRKPTSRGRRSLAEVIHRETF